MATITNTTIKIKPHRSVTNIYINLNISGSINPSTWILLTLNLTMITSVVTYEITHGVNAQYLKCKMYYKTSFVIILKKFNET